MIDKIQNKELEGLFFNTDDFVLHEKSIGEGSFGKVYIAHQASDDKLYAVKILNTEKGMNGHDQMLFMRESLILHKLKHPCIVEFIGVNFQSFTDPSKLSPSIITEYLPHGSLKTILDQEKRALADFNWTSTKKLINLIGIACAMKYLHEQGVIHRDLKPENILTDENYYPRICDFGLSRYFAESLSNNRKITQTGQIGTPIYMAPELFQQNCRYGPAVDVFAFAMIAYEIVTGKVPLVDINVVDPVTIAFQTSQGHRPLIPDTVHPKMANLIRRCWCQKPENRPSFGEIYNELLNDLSILGDDVDQAEIEDYIDMLNEKITNSPKENNNIILRSTPNKKLEEEIRRLKNKCSQLEAEIKTRENHYIFDIRSLTNQNNDLQKQCKLKDSQLKECNQKLKASYRDLQANFWEKEIEYEECIQNLRAENSNLQKNLKSIEIQFSEYIQKLKAEKSEPKKKPQPPQPPQHSQISLDLFSIGICKLIGDRDEINPAEGLSYLKQSSEEGNSHASFICGLLYETGDAGQRNFQKSVFYYKRSTAQGNSHGLKRIGHCYHLGYGVGQSYEDAVEYYKESARLGNSYAFNSLGICYLNGEGVEMNYRKAIEYYNKAAQLGNSDALNNIGLCYENGQGVEQDFSKAFEYYEKSAKMGNIYALNSLGFCYENGNGTDRDYRKAIEYYNKSSILGNSIARENLRRLKTKFSNLSNSFIYEE